MPPLPEAIFGKTLSRFHYAIEADFAQNSTPSKKKTLRHLAQFVIVDVRVYAPFPTRERKRERGGPSIDRLDFRALSLFLVFLLEAKTVFLTTLAFHTRTYGHERGSQLRTLDRC